MKKFLIGLLSLTAVTVSGLYLLHFELGVGLPSFRWHILLFVATLSYIIHKFLVQNFADDPAKFSIGYMASVALRLLVYGAFLAVVVYLDQTGAWANTILFLCFYLLTALNDIVFLIRSPSKKRSDTDRDTPER